ncbi:MAG: response regulator [Candidatus Scalinduaceae bacterium]
MAKGRILIIEDNLMNMELFSDLLEDEGYLILQAVNGKEGFNMAKSEIPDLILLDSGLPDIGGVELVRKFKQYSITKNITLIVCSASTMKEEKKMIMNAGCDAFISKPIDTKEFVKTIARFLKN